MQQSSTETPDGPVAERPVGETTVRLPVGEKTVRIPLNPSAAPKTADGTAAGELREHRTEPSTAQKPAEPVVESAAAPQQATAPATSLAEVGAAAEPTLLERYEAPSGEKTVRIPVAPPAAAAGVGEKTVRIPLDAADESVTRVLSAPVITTDGPLPPAAAPAVPTPVDLDRDTRPGFALVGVLAALAGAAAQLVPHGPLRLVLLLGLIGFGPGAAVLSAVRVRDRLAAWALTVTGSLTVTVGAAVVTLWTHIWQPAATLGALAGATLLACAVQLVRLARAGIRWSPRVVLNLGGDTDRSRGRLWSAVPFVTLTGAIGLWIVALTRLTPAGVGAYGFTAALGLPFVVAVALLATGFAVELFGRARPLVLTGVLLTVPVFMQATVPLLDGTLEYAWTYKHIGVVDLLRDNGHLLDSTDIYQQWPGFFAVVAILSRVSAVDALSFAAWSSLTFALINTLLVAALLRQFTANRRVIVLGVLLSQIAMWVDIGYFSPQALVYSLMLGFWVIVVRWLTATPARPEPVGRIGRLRAWLLRDMPQREEPGRGTRMRASVAATAVFAAITVSHQLTPVVMMFPLVVLAVLGVLRPRLLVVLLGAVLAAFIAPRMGSVSSQYSLFDFDLLANAAGNAAGWNTPQQEFSATVARSLAIGVWGAALFVVWRSRRRLGSVLVPALLAFLPMATLAGGNYGGEAIYRVFAFSLPFAGLLIAGAWTGLRRQGVTTMLVSGVLLAAVLLAALQGLHGQLVVHQVRATDITAAEYFYANAEPGSALVLVAPNFPTKLTGNYGSFNRGHVSVDISLAGDPVFTGTLGGSRLPDVETYIRQLGYATNYLVVSKAMAQYTDYFGTEPAGSMASLETALRLSSDWTLFYQGPDVAIFKLRS
jgi:hypothetical protein